jgi:hypothetical protein
MKKILLPIMFLVSCTSELEKCTEANFNRIEESHLFQIKYYCENDLGHTEETIEKQCLVPLKKAQAIKVCNSQGIY